MRVLAATLAVLLLVAICSLTEADRRGSSNAAPSKNKNEPSECCFKYTRIVPRRMIHSAYVTSPSCPMPAVVLVTRKGKQLCADPTAAWVQKYLEDLELPQNWLFPASDPGQRDQPPARE